MKYKVGDKVRVRKDLSCGVVYRMENNPNVADSFTEGMSHLRGNIVTISEYHNGKYYINEETCYHYNWTDEMFEPVNNEKIVITTNGKTTLARLYRDDKVVKRAEARCHDDDKFDFKEGAKIALERLCELDSPKFNVGDYAIVTKQSDCHCFKVGTVVRITRCHNGAYICVDDKGTNLFMTANELKPCNYYTGRAVCIKADSTTLTVGKVYNFAERNCCGKNDAGNGILCSPATSLEEINNRLCGDIKFIEFKGE